MPATGEARQFDGFIPRKGDTVDAGFLFRLLPKRPIASWRLREGCAPIERAQAVSAPYLVLNSETHINWLTVDIDRPMTIDELLDAISIAGLPMPAFAVRNANGCRRAGRLHVTWCLATPVQRGGKGRARPQAYLRRIQRALTAALGGDPGFTNTLVKNPFSAGTNEKPFQTTWFDARAVDLHELADRLDLELPATRGRTQIRGLGRNCDLFDMLRGHAYGTVDDFRRAGDRKGFETDLQARAAEFNLEFAKRLGPREIMTVARSVAKWTWVHFRGRKSRDVDGRRQAGARRVVARRDRVLAVLLERRRRGEPLTLAALARDLDLPRRTLQRYLAVFRRLPAAQMQTAGTPETSAMANAPRIHTSGSAPALAVRPSDNDRASPGLDPPKILGSRARKPDGRG